MDLEDIAGEFEMQFDEASQYYEKTSDEIVFIQDEYFRTAEGIETDDEINDYHGWEQDIIRAAIKILEGSEDYIALPNKFDIDEYSMMEEFACDYPNEMISDALSEAIDGRGAFRMFKSTIRRFGIEQEWYKWRDNSYLEIAKEWCEDNGIAYSRRKGAAPGRGL
jgi:hypothetical protein